MNFGPLRVEHAGEIFPWCQVWVWGVRVHHWHVGLILVAHDHRDLLDSARKIGSALTSKRPA